MLAARDLKKVFRPGPFSVKRSAVRALEGVSLEVMPGKTLGIVGESGCGKSTLARILAAVLTPDGGEVAFDGKPLSRFGRADWRKFRRSVGIIFQDPFLSLNPRMRVGAVLKEPFRIHRIRPAGGLSQAVEKLLLEVGLPARMADRLPRELSGGERQRVSIARAVALGPKILICDEPVSSLDVLVQAQILNLLLRLQEEKGLGYLFISHDLRVVRHMSDDLAVLDEGRIVEQGPASQVLRAPKTPATAELLRSTDLSALK